MLKVELLYQKIRVVNHDELLLKKKKKHKHIHNSIDLYVIRIIEIVN